MPAGGLFTLLRARANHKKTNHMATLTFEVFSRFQSATDANKLLYTPIADQLTYNHTRLYTIECEGDTEAAAAYMRSVLVDSISQKVYVFGQGDAAALSARFCKDVCNPAIHTWKIN